MSKKEQAPVTTKQPKSVQVKLLVPWGLILVLAFTIAGFIGGFHYNQQIEHDVQIRASVLADTLKNDVK